MLHTGEDIKSGKLDEIKKRYAEEGATGPKSASDCARERFALKEAIRSEKTGVIASYSGFTYDIDIPYIGSNKKEDDGPKNQETRKEFDKESRQYLQLLGQGRSSADDAFGTLEVYVGKGVLATKAVVRRDDIMFTQRMTVEPLSSDTNEKCY